MSQKIFDDFPKIDCDDCEHYWGNACDGVSKGSEKPCKTFLATRKVNIPEEIKRLRKDVKHLSIYLMGFEILFILHILIDILTR